jgi:hypothetical protein
MLENLPTAVAPPQSFLMATYVTPGVSYVSDFKDLVRTSSNHTSSNAATVTTTYQKTLKK